MYWSLLYLYSQKNVETRTQWKTSIIVSVWLMYNVKLFFGQMEYIVRSTQCVKRERIIAWLRYDACVRERGVVEANTRNL